MSYLMGTSHWKALHPPKWVDVSGAHQGTGAGAGAHPKGDPTSAPAAGLVPDVP